MTMQYQVAELEGELLDAAVALAKGDAPGAAYSSDWSHGGPIIARERIALAPVGRTYKAWFAEVGGVEFDSGVEVGYGEHSGQDPAPLVAAMRAFCASKFGETVELP